MQPQDECGLTLHEAILGGALQRPIHYSELVLDVTLKWGNWGEEDRRDNYLLLKRNILYEEAIGKTIFSKRDTRRGQMPPPPRWHFI